MSCDPTKYQSETIFWDDKNYKVYLPENINYSIKNIEIPSGKKKIIWDNNGVHHVNITDSYSYSIIPLKSFIISAALRKNGSNWSGVTNRLVSAGNKIFDSVVIGNNGQSSYSNVGVSELIWLSVKFTDGSMVALRNSYAQGLGVFSAHLSSLQPSNDTAGYILRILHNGNRFDYSLSNRNSVQVVDVPGSIIKKININGNEYDLMDENSIEVLCTDPLPQCPGGTLECDCGNGIIWCLVENDKGYTVVQCISY